MSPQEQRKLTNAIIGSLATAILLWFGKQAWDSKADKSELEQVKLMQRIIADSAKAERAEIVKESKINRYLLCEVTNSQDSYCKGPRP